MKRLLVIAGTHQREIEFSHKVASALVDLYGKPESYEEITGIDGARKSGLWIYDKIAVAKILRIGETSKEYLDRLSPERRQMLEEFRARNPTAEISERFEHNRQWTSCHNPVIEKTNPYIILDLHSWHKHSEGINGTGAEIFSYTQSEAQSELEKAIIEAKKKEPETYGIMGVSAPYTDEEELRNLNLRKVARDWGNNWHFREYKMGYHNESPNEFCFEAVHWGEEQVNATVKFINRYLLPSLKRSE